MVCTIHLPFPGRMTHPPWRSTWPPQLQGGSAEKQSIPSEMPRKPGAGSSRIQMKALFCLVTEVYRTRDRGGWSRTRLGSSMHPTSSAGGLALTWLRAGRSARRFPRLSPDSPSGQTVNSGGQRVSPNKQVSCSGLKTMASLERVCFSSKDGLLLSYGKN